MKLLFVCYLPGQTRHFLGLLRELGGRGHSTRLLLYNKAPGTALRIPEYLEGIPNLSVGELDRRADGFWTEYEATIRFTRNCLHFYHPKLAGGEPARARAVASCDPFLARFLPQRPGRPPRFLKGLLDLLNSCIPVPREIAATLEREAPDAVMVTPLIFNETIEQIDYVKAAHALGVPVAFPVFSWDNLSTKGSLSVLPDEVHVWNEVQRREAVDVHGVPDGRVKVLGAWRFDDFVALGPSLDRAAYCARHGFDPAQPLLLYLGSSPFAAPNEDRFLAEWLKHLRASDQPRLRRANVLVRAHPRAAGSMREIVEAVGGGAAAVQDAGETTFFDAQVLYDAIFHSAAVVGVNTSALLEAAALGTSVHAVECDLLESAQKSVIHFEYLNDGGSGLFHLARDFPEHERMLSAALERQERGQGADPRSVQFRGRFLDPPGPGKAATIRLADRLERLASMTKAPQPRGLALELCAALARAALTLRVLPLRRRASLAGVRRPTPGGKDLRTPRDSGMREADDAHPGH